MSLSIVTGVTLCLVLIDATGLTEARSVHRRHHHHHHHWNHFDQEESVPRELSLSRLNGLNRQQQPSWAKEMDVDGSVDSFARKKRLGAFHPQRYQQTHSALIVKKVASDENMYELEVEKAQNMSVCNYTVEPIEDIEYTRIPRSLKHIKCNHLGSECHSDKPYYCLQTFKDVMVKYINSTVETPLRIYTGCVCALYQADNYFWQPSTNS